METTAMPNMTRLAQKYCHLWSSPQRVREVVTAHLLLLASLLNN